MNIMSASTFQDFEFKYVRTGRSKFISVDIESTMTEFLNDVGKFATFFFGADNLYIIEAGQFNNINGNSAELAPPLCCSDIKFKDYFSDRLETTCFYVRDVDN